MAKKITNQKPKSEKEINEELENLGEAPAHSETELDEVLAIEPDKLTEDQKEIIKEKQDDLSDEDREKYAGILTETPPAEPEPTPDQPKLEDILNKEPADVTDEERTIIEENSAELTDEQREKFGIEAAPAAEVGKPADPADPKEEDYKEKFIHSTQEAQVLHSKSKKYEEAVLAAANLPEPTDDEMKTEYPDWDMMGDLERKLAKDNRLNKIRFGGILGVVEESKKVDEWAGKVDSFIGAIGDSGNYPEIKGREQDFRSFAMKESRRGVDLNDLVRAFLFDAPAPTAPKHKGSLLEVGTGGERAKTTSLSVDEIAAIRKRDPRAYARLVKEGKIKIEL